MNALRDTTSVLFRVRNLYDHLGGYPVGYLGGVSWGVTIHFQNLLPIRMHDRI